MLDQSLAAELIAAVRETNPTRKLIVGGTNWNNVSALADLQLPDDPNLIGTFH